MQFNQNFIPGANLCMLEVPCINISISLPSLFILCLWSGIRRGHLEKCGFCSGVPARLTYRVIKMSVSPSCSGYCVSSEMVRVLIPQQYYHHFQEFTHFDTGSLLHIILIWMRLFSLSKNSPFFFLIEQAPCQFKITVLRLSAYYFLCMYH